MKIMKWSWIGLFALLYCCSAMAQVAPGTPSFSAYDTHGVDTVNLMNNNVLLSIPVMSKAGTLPFSFQLSGNYGMTTSAGKWALLPQLIGFADNSMITSSGYATHNNVNCPVSGTTTKYDNFYLVSQDGTVHKFLSTDFTDKTAGGTSCLTGSGFTDTVLDNSGITATYQSNAFSPGNNIWTRDGVQHEASAILDANSNEITKTYNAGPNNFTWTDSMGFTVLTVTNATYPSYTWSDVSGGSPAVTYTTSSTIHEKSNFACTTSPTDYDNTNQTLPSSINFPDGTSIGLTYEGTRGNAGDYTGRINQITLQEGGTVAYTYSGGTNAIDCTYQNAPVLTRTLGNGDVTTYSLTHPQIGATANYQAVNTVTDPGGNKSVYTFSGFTSTGASTSNQQLLTEVDKKQGTTLLTTDLISYNTAYTSTPSASTINGAVVAAGTQISKKIVYYQINGMSNWSATEYHYDSYGNATYVASYDFGGASAASAITTTYGSCTASCTTTSPTISNTSMAANYIFDRPGSIETQQNGTIVGWTNLTYNATGQVTSTQIWNGGSALIGQTTANTINANGTPSKVYDLANNETDFTYDSTKYSDTNGCSAMAQTPFPTKIKNVGTGMYTQATYDCVGGVKLTGVDAAGNTTTYGYTYGGGAEPYWRVSSVTDPYSAVAYKTYPNGTNPDLYSPISFTFNSSNSTNDTVITTDGYGRPVNSQTYQSPGGTNFDTISTTYGWSGNYFSLQTSQPCSAAGGGTCTAAHTQHIDPLGRLYQEATTSNETITHTYTKNDDLMELTPAPTGENEKQVQTQYDGLGRVSKVCHIGSTASTGSGTACGQNSGSANGTSEVYTYGQGSGYTTVQIVRGSETRTFTYDAMGRMTKKVTPEGGTWNYYYDSYVTGCGQSGTNNGKLTCSVDPNGYTLLYYYDALNRPTDSGQAAGSGGTCKRFRYDSVSNSVLGSLPTGVASPTYTSGRLIEAETDDCTSPVTAAHQFTDEWFSYDKDGRVLIAYESTPNSTQYYKSTATFFDNGAVNTLALTSPSLYTMTYALDGEGRVDYAKVGTTVMVNSETFNAAGQPTAVALIGASNDNDAYTYDSNTGKMLTYGFTVGATPATLTGTLTWNANGTLSKVVTSDGFNAGGSLTCLSNSTGASGGYDDWTRLVGFDCGNGNWGQQFTYDVYDNLSKAPNGTGRTGTTWNPGYNASVYNNQFTGGTFDSNGNTKADGTGSNYWGWNEWSKMAWNNSSSTAPTCGTGGKCMTYDASGRPTEESSGATWREIWHTQAGDVNMSGTTANYGYWPINGAGTVIVTGNNGNEYYVHNDWLGNGRVGSAHNRTVSVDQAYTPYGEIFANYGSTSAYFDLFAGTTANFNNGIQAETPNRELAVFSRWLSPDSTQGGQWNTYAYPTNPNSQNDPTGLGSEKFTTAFSHARSPNVCVNSLSPGCVAEWEISSFLNNNAMGGYNISQYVWSNGVNGDGAGWVLNPLFNGGLNPFTPNPGTPDGHFPTRFKKGDKNKPSKLVITPLVNMLVPMFKGFSENPYAFFDTETGQTLNIDGTLNGIVDASTDLGFTPGKFVDWTGAFTGIDALLGASSFGLGNTFGLEVATGAAGGPIGAGFVAAGMGIFALGVADAPNLVSCNFGGCIGYVGK